MSTRVFKIGATGRLDDCKTKMHESVGLNKFPPVYLINFTRIDVAIRIGA